PADHLHVGQQIKARVMEIDYDKEKISLSMKIEGESPRPRPTTPSQSPIEKTPPRVSEESTLKSNISWG
ncbi:S1 RNA-binding domain-containing protein, partial [Patescibacteria group bacterium]|nr:S1 RNA-binding domain-containing protein [Patescibacteria group bacterium]